MTVRAEKLQVFQRVILVVSIQMMDLEHQFLSVPVSDSTDFAMRIILQDTTDVFPLEIHCLYLCAIPEYFIILSVYQFAEIML